jgi:hypothetical protein
MIECVLLVVILLGIFQHWFRPYTEIFKILHNCFDSLGLVIVYSFYAKGLYYFFHWQTGLVWIWIWNKTKSLNRIFIDDNNNSVCLITYLWICVYLETFLLVENDSWSRRHSRRNSQQCHHKGPGDGLDGHSIEVLEKKNRSKEKFSKFWTILTSITSNWRNEKRTIPSSCLRIYHPSTWRYVQNCMDNLIRTTGSHNFT